VGRENALETLIGTVKRAFSSNDLSLTGTVWLTLDNPDLDVRGWLLDLEAIGEDMRWVDEIEKAFEHFKADHLVRSNGRDPLVTMLVAYVIWRLRPELGDEDGRRAARKAGLIVPGTDH
jgi:hypothetical protein